MAVITRFQKTARASLIITGNVLGLAGDANGEGLLNFTVANPPLPPSGSTTTTWQNNSSSAILSLPAANTILYAELTWSGQFNSSISGNLGTAITFETPNGSYSISPDPATAQNILVGVGSFYSRTQDVTSIIQSDGEGIYTVRGVPGLISGSNNYLGWCLIVAVSTQTLPIRNITVWAMLEQILGGSGMVDVPITNFVTPPIGPVTGRVLVSTGGGNSQLTGDYMQFGVTTSNLLTLSGPNNPSSNFFCSQINNGDSLSASVGQIDTSGTFGTWNSNPPLKADTGDRNSFDITNVNALGLTNNQTTGVIRFGTTSDTYQAIALGFQIDVNAPFLTPILKTAPQNAEVGETFTYTISFQNTGVANADNTVFVDTIPNETIFVPNSLRVNGVTVPGGNPAAPNGVLIGTVAVNQSITVTFNVLVTSIPSSGVLNNKSEIGYTYSPGIGVTPISTNENSNTVKTLVKGANIISSQKFVDKEFANCGDTLNYIIQINNIGLYTALNVFFSDTIPNGTTLVPSSVKINNVTSPNANLTAGITVPDIGPNTTTTITYSLVITCL